jgi:hypothetical protein
MLKGTLAISNLKLGSFAFLKDLTDLKIFQKPLI